MNHGRSPTHPGCFLSVKGAFHAVPSQLLRAALSTDFKLHEGRDCGTLCQKCATFMQLARHRERLTDTMACVFILKLYSVQAASPWVRSHDPLQRAKRHSVSHTCTHKQTCIGTCVHAQACTCMHTRMFYSEICGLGSTGS